MAAESNQPAAVQSHAVETASGIAAPVAHERDKAAVRADRKGICIAGIAHGSKQVDGCNAAIDWHAVQVVVVGPDVLGLKNDGMAIWREFKLLHALAGGETPLNISAGPPPTGVLKSSR